MSPKDAVAGEGQQGATEYIRAMLEYARDDARQVYLRVTAALAAAVLILTQLPYKELKALETFPKALYLVGLGALVGAALLDHAYLQRIHHTRVQLAKCLIEADATTAQSLGPTKWADDEWLLKLGDGVLAVGILCVASVVVVLFA